MSLNASAPDPSSTVVIAHGLSERQAEVLLLVGMGAADRDIAGGGSVLATPHSRPGRRFGLRGTDSVLQNPYPDTAGGLGSEHATDRRAGLTHSVGPT